MKWSFKLYIKKRTSDGRLLIIYEKIIPGKKYSPDKTIFSFSEEHMKKKYLRNLENFEVFRLRCVF